MNNIWSKMNIHRLCLLSLYVFHIPYFRGIRGGVRQINRGFFSRDPWGEQSISLLAILSRQYSNEFLLPHQP